MRRRTFLAVTGAGMLTGCNALGGKKFTNAEDPFSGVQTVTGLEEDESGNSATANLPQGTYASFSFELQEPSEMALEGQAVKGGPIDIYVMTINQFNNYQRNEQIVGRNSYEVGAESTGSIEVTQQFQPGEYLIVFDNTHVGDASPSGEASIDFKFTLTGTGRSQGNTTSTPS